MQRAAARTYQEAVECIEQPGLELGRTMQRAAARIYQEAVTCIEQPGLELGSRMMSSILITLSQLCSVLLQEHTKKQLRALSNLV